jgi:nucleolar pre-ribosomal-associated protein 2
MLTNIDSKEVGEGKDDEDLSLQLAYSNLADKLRRADEIRQFCLVSEILEFVLRTKPRTVSQWNVDNTLATISLICSRQGPSLSPQHAGTIYFHLCRLLQTILTVHRLKLQGHFHLLVQTMQALLRCLVTPLPHGAAKAAKLYPQPLWLSAAAPLGAKHAVAYTRLLTLICNPSVSSVTRSSTRNALVSATAKAERMAGQHMPIVLSTYIRLQLEMKMSTEVREKMVPGLYAIFDTTTTESRRVLGESLDSSGRAVLGGLVRDYLRFGKWKGA